MRSIHRTTLSAIALIAGALVGPIAAQAPGSGTVLHISPYAGYMVFGNYLKGPMGTSLSNAPAPMFGTQVGLSLAPDISLVGNVAYATSDMKVGIPFLGGFSVGNSSMLIYDASIEYNLGTMKQGALPLSPFVQAGVGAMKYDVSASVLNTKATNFAGNIGAGVDLTVGKGMALRVLAKDYIGKFNFKDATGLGISGNTAHNWAVTAGLRCDF
jgi:hypothetical protein